MEERVAGSSGSSSSSSKDKKYVLYTVVGEDKARTTPGAWMIRVLLGSLMIVALAVVPYVSLRLAQTNSRTLVVFQPVPMHNRTSNHHSGSHKLSASRNVKAVHLMQVADLTLENYTASLNSNETGKENVTSVVDPASKLESAMNVTTVVPIASVELTSGGNNSVLVTLHETDITIAVLEDNSTTTSDLNKTGNADKTKTETTSLPQTETYAENMKNAATTASPNKNKVKMINSLQVNDSRSTVIPSSSNDTVNVSTAAAKSTSSMKPNSPTSASDQHTKTTYLFSVIISSTAAPTTEKLSSTAKPSLNNVSSSAPKQKALSHKLVYVATSASGNHVGGICMWKVDKNVTNWSYFYDNIPIEFQSGHDTGDHELRATLAAVRTWSNEWQDAHVTLRSQHNAIEHSDLAVRAILTDELEKLSDGHFTYELEWRLPEADTLVKISNSLSRLHQDYKYWLQDFKSHVDGLLGKQNWSETLHSKHITVKDEAYFTTEKYKTKLESPKQASPVNGSSSGRLITTSKPKLKTPQPLSHKLVYVATSASGNHVGGFCMWKLDKNVTSWSYFFDNIPVEYQSNHDSTDHEQRATLAAVRVWADRWQDAHVTLRSQHAAIERSDSNIRKILIDNLNKYSEGHFTYDLEWRLRKSDDLVKISFSLSRLHRGFAHWFAVFKASVDDVLGPQDWDTATKANRVLLSDEFFYTEESHPADNKNSLKSTLPELKR